MLLEDSDDNPPSGTRYGKYPAVVIDNDLDEEGGHTGRIRVRIPGILEEDEQGEPRPIEVIARPCFPPGFFFIPPERSHVWVEFAAGDINSPIWVGVWYKQGAPPETSAGTAPNAQQKVIRTPGGHVITLDDDGPLTLTHRNGETRIEISDRSVTIHASREVVLGGEGTKTAVLKLDSLGFLPQVILSHTHIGNMGVPTGPPDFPVNANATLLMRPADITATKVVVE